tara:strand:+ start:36 stop:329 length:294 start_codon:yes stop_codon:yes gene_type:complete
MAKIREDKHGLFMVCSGSIYRPVFPAGWAWANAGANSGIFPGQVLKTKRHSGTELTTITKEDGHTVMWFSHGSAAGGDIKQRAPNIYKPEHHTWERI